MIIESPDTTSYLMAIVMDALSVNILMVALSVNILMVALSVNILMVALSVNILMDALSLNILMDALSVNILMDALSLNILMVALSVNILMDALSVNILMDALSVNIFIVALSVNILMDALSLNILMIVLKCAHQTILKLIAIILSGRIQLLQKFFQAGFNCCNNPFRQDSTAAIFPKINNCYVKSYLHQRTSQLHIRPEVQKSRYPHTLIQSQNFGGLHNVL